MSQIGAGMHTSVGDMYIAHVGGLSFVADTDINSQP